MVEFLCKTDQSAATAQETEFFVIRLVDLGLDFEPRFLIREIHAAWSDSEQRIELNVHGDGLRCTSEDAQRHYAARKTAIVAKGFNCSNLEPSGAYSVGTEAVDTRSSARGDSRSQVTGIDTAKANQVNHRVCGLNPVT